MYYFGVFFDGLMIVFVRYWGGSFKVNGLFLFMFEVFEYFVDVFRGLMRKFFDVEMFLRDFGLKSWIMEEVFRVFYSVFELLKLDRIEMFFEDWRRIFF